MIFNPAYHHQPAHHPSCQSQNIATRCSADGAFHSVTVIESLSVCLRRPCVRLAICMTVHRSKAIWKCLFNRRYGGLVVRITVLCLCLYTPFNVKIPMRNCMKMHHLKWRITKIFWGGGTARTPPPRRLDARHLDARHLQHEVPWAIATDLLRS